MRLRVASTDNVHIAVLGPSCGICPAQYSVEHNLGTRAQRPLLSTNFAKAVHQALPDS